MATLRMPHPHVPHPSERLSSLAAFVVQAFWVIALGIVLVFAFFVLLGAIDPGQVVPVSIAVGALALLGVARAWAMSHRARHGRDPELVRARERRGF